MSLQAEQLLRSALEKIVFFECRVEAMEAEMNVARTAATRAQEEAARVRTRLVGLETDLAESRGSLADALSKNEALLERVRLLEEERERFLATFIEQARVTAAPMSAPTSKPEEHADGIDLGAFIAELREEVQRLRAWKEAGQAAGLVVEEPNAPRTLAELRADAATTVSEVAGRFESAGRIGLDEGDHRRAELLLATRAERALYETSMNDLASDDAAARCRAAECLKALGSRAAAPLVAAALGREEDADVKAALLGAMAALAPQTSAAELALRELADPRPRVRVAALAALAELEGEACTPKLLGALGDPSNLVRRRAVLGLGYFANESAEEGLIGALIDTDAGVARAAALALAGRPSRKAQGALVRALEHRDESVRRASSSAVSRWSGERLSAAASPAEQRRAVRRLMERLDLLDDAGLRARVGSAAAPTAPAPKAPSIPAAPSSTVSASATAAAPSSTVLASATAAPRPAGSKPSNGGALEGAILNEVRISLRGCTADELAAHLATSPAAVSGALRRLLAHGSVVARGPRYYLG